MKCNNIVPEEKKLKTVYILYYIIRQTTENI